MEKQLLQLEERVQKILEKKNSLIDERLSYPLDSLSVKTFQTGQIVFTGKVITDVVGAQLTDLNAIGLGIKINGKARFVVAVMPLKPFTAATTDIITTTSGNHNLVASDRMYLTTTNTLPAGLTTIDTYYPVSITSTTLKVSLTEGGSPIDITDIGIGTHYYAKL